jgi:hypothetical protein
MLELWQHAISPINLPFTVLLGLVLFYWAMVILGFLDMDHAHADFGVNGHVDGHIEGDVHAHADSDVHTGQPGMFSGFLQFLHMGEMPFMIVVSILSVALWAGSLLLNYYFNPGLALTTAVLILVPLFVVAVVVTHYAALPIKKMYQLMERDYDTHKSVIGQVGNVVTSEVTPCFGQIEIMRSGAPVTLNARTSEGKVLKKGDKALVTEASKDRKTFSVIKYEPTELED